MICTTNTGRKELEKCNWISHLNSNLGILNELNIRMVMYSQEYLLILLHTYVSKGRLKKLLGSTRGGKPSIYMIDLGEICFDLEEY